MSRSRFLRTTLGLGLVVATAACGSVSSRAPTTGASGASATGPAGGGGAGVSGGAGADGGAGASGGAGADGGAGASDDAAADASGSAGSGAGGASGIDGGLARAPGCPPGPMIPSGSCSPGLSCDYRAAGVRPTCVTRLTCEGQTKGLWYISNTGAGCGTPNDAACPATFTSLMEGAACPLAQGSCDYDQGRCKCVPCAFGGPPTAGMWSCRAWDSGGASCPAVSPLAGTACVMPDQFCTYGGSSGSCGVSVGDNYQCTGGYWRVLPSLPGTCAIQQCPSFRCSFSAAAAAPAAATPGASVEARATAAALAKYDALVGRFLRGDVKVYKGTLSALAVSPLNDSPPPHTTTTMIPEGPALAMLDVRATDGSDWSPPLTTVPAGDQTAVLVIHGSTAREYLVYGQRRATASVTWTGFIESDDPVVGVSGNTFFSSCTGCVQDLGSRPDRIVLDKVATMATAHVLTTTVDVDVSVTTSASAVLQAIEPCALRWPDLTTLNTALGPAEFSDDVGLRGFTENGDVLVAQQTGSFIDGPISRGVCGVETSYSIDLFVSTADLATHGTRNFQVTGTGMVCAP